MEGAYLSVVTRFVATLMVIYRGWPQVPMAVRALSELLDPTGAPNLETHIEQERMPAHVDCALACDLRRSVRAVFSPGYLANAHYLVREMHVNHSLSVSCCACLFCLCFPVDRLWTTIGSSRTVMGSKFLHCQNGPFIDDQ